MHYVWRVDEGELDVVADIHDTSELLLVASLYGGSCLMCNMLSPRGRALLWDATHLLSIDMLVLRHARESEDANRLRLRGSVGHGS